MSIQIFGTINKRGVQISSGGWKTNQNITSGKGGGGGVGMLIWHSRVIWLEVLALVSNSSRI